MNNLDFQNSIKNKIALEKVKYNSIIYIIIRCLIYFVSFVGLLGLMGNMIGLLGISTFLVKFSTIVFGIGILELFYDSFMRYKYFHYVPVKSLEKAFHEKLNLADYFDDNSVKVINDAFREAKEHGYIRVDPIIILNTLQNTEEGRYIFTRIGANKPEAFANIIIKAVNQLSKGQGKVELSDKSVKALFESAKLALLSKRNYISIGDIIVGILKTDKTFQDIIFELHLKPEEIEDVIRWYHIIKLKIDKVPFWKKNSFGTSIAQDWSFGYTPILSRFAYDMNESQEREGHREVYGRDKEIFDMERILAKSKDNNIILIGDKGIGKGSIIEGLVQKIRSDEVMEEIRHCHIFQLDTGAVLSGATEQGEIEARLTMIFNDVVRAGNIILFIEDFHSLVSSKKEVGQINASEILSPYLKGVVRVIATTNNKNYHEDVEANPSIAQSFEKITVKEPSEKTVIDILEDVSPYIEARSKVFFTYQDLKEIVRLSAKYITDKPFPRKAIDLLDEVAVKASQSGSKFIDIKVIDQIVTEKTEVPVAEPEGGEKEKLLHLEDFLHKRVIGQDEAISAISNAMRRARSGLASKNKPVGAFLFLGPTGVGKTETARALAAAYFGSEKTMIRFDMSEFQEQSSLYRLVGSPPSAGRAGTKGELVTQVKDKPFSLVLLDEMEKAYPQILTLFLQVFDEGSLSAGTGDKINFQNTIIICTSNAGSELIRENLQKGVKGEELKVKLLECLQTKGVFKPEFLNRFDGVIAFHPLSEKEIQKVAKLMLKKLSEKMKEKEINLNFTEQAVEKLAKEGYDPVYGARPMRRTIQEKVENSIAQKLLTGAIKRGDKIVLDEKDI